MMSMSGLIIVGLAILADLIMEGDLVKTGPSKHSAISSVTYDRVSIMLNELGLHRFQTVLANS